MNPTQSVDLSELHAVGIGVWKGSHGAVHSIVHLQYFNLLVTTRTPPMIDSELKLLLTL